MKSGFRKYLSTFSQKQEHGIFEFPSTLGQQTVRKEVPMNLLLFIVDWPESDSTAC